MKYEQQAGSTETRLSWEPGEANAAEAALLHDAMWALAQDIPMRWSPVKRGVVARACSARLALLALNSRAE